MCAVSHDLPVTDYLATGSFMRIADLSRFEPIPLRSCSWPPPAGWRGMSAFRLQSRQPRLQASAKKHNPSSHLPRKSFGQNCCPAWFFCGFCGVGEAGTTAVEKSIDDSNQHPFREAPWMRPVPPLEVHALACLPISGNLAALGSPNEVAQVSMY